MIDAKFSCMIDLGVLGLDAFRSRVGVHVHTQRFGWDHAWDELLRIALRGQIPDVSEIGSTWLGSLIERSPSVLRGSPAILNRPSWPPGDPFVS